MRLLEEEEEEEEKGGQEKEGKERLGRGEGKCWTDNEEEEKKDVDEYEEENT